MITFGTILLIDLLCEWTLNLKSSLKDKTEKKLICAAALSPIIFISLVLNKRFDLLSVTFFMMYSIQTAAYTYATNTVLIRVYPHEFKSSTFNQMRAILTLSAIIGVHRGDSSMINRIFVITVATIGGFVHKLTFGRLRDVINHYNYDSKPFIDYSFEEVYATSYLAIYTILLISVTMVTVTFACDELRLGIFIYSISSPLFIILAVNLPPKLAKKRKYGAEYTRYSL